MNEAVPDSLVQNYETRVADLTLPDPDDVHVLAAAIHASCDAIVTFNVKDFPKDYVAQYDIELLHPDEFLFNQFGRNTTAMVFAAQRCRARLRNPARSAVEYLDALERQNLPKTVTELRAYRSLI